MTAGLVQVVLTDRAKADYNAIVASALRCMRSEATDRGPASHLDRTRSILRSLRDPGAVESDQPMINELSWMLSRSLGNSYAYYGRNSSTNDVVVFHLCAGTTDNLYTLLAEIVLAGKTDILTALGITPPPLPRSYSITIH